MELISRGKKRRKAEIEISLLRREEKKIVRQIFLLHTN
jgi:hypothetical protein